VSWFGATEECWVCGGTADGPVEVVPPNGSETWCAARCAQAAEDEETAAVLRRVNAPAPARHFRPDASASLLF